jgi:MoaA/NifB/PqqE/SkfB family radical SAM enzyme
MSTSRKVKVLHLEPTDVCQAACAACARVVDTTFDASMPHHLSMAEILQVFPGNLIQDLEKMFMCGNYGDPAAGRYTLDIYNEFRRVNPSIVLGMNTNGGLQSASWWRELATVLCQTQDYVVFSIDGLSDTNHVYRVGVDWRRVMRNVETFISAGGTAHWDMLIYRHNQHQVNQCETLAREMGFKWFRTKVSSRPLYGALQSPDGYMINHRHSKPIDCHALHEDSAYISAQGKLYPCCWHGHRRSTVHDIIQVQATWHRPRPDSVCLSACGRSQSTTRFKNQWQSAVELTN